MRTAHVPPRRKGKTRDQGNANTDFLWQFKHYRESVATRMAWPNIMAKIVTGARQPPARRHQRPSKIEAEAPMRAQMRSRAHKKSPPNIGCAQEQLSIVEGPSVLFQSFFLNIFLYSPRPPKPLPKGFQNPPPNLYFYNVFPIIFDCYF